MDGVSCEFFGRVLDLMSNLFGDHPLTVDQIGKIQLALAEAERAYKDKPVEPT